MAKRAVCANGKGGAMGPEARPGCSSRAASGVRSSCVCYALNRFGRFADQKRQTRGEGSKPETFNFLGFTHICGKARNGALVLNRRTMKVRMRAKLQQVKAELKQRMHQSVTEQGKWLASVVRGHIATYGMPTNAHALSAFRDQVVRYWRSTLRRRSQTHRMSWTRIGRLKQRWLPPARIQHPWPEVRFDARTRGRSSVR
jgi:hypothetical protein